MHILKLGTLLLLVLTGCGLFRPAKEGWTVYPPLSALPNPEPVQLETFTFTVCDSPNSKTWLDKMPYQEAAEERAGNTWFAGRKVADSLFPARMHGWMQAVHTAYDQHLPLVLSPDAIWLLICQGFSLHINENFEKYRDRLLNFKGTEQIYVRIDTLAIDPDLAWAQLMDSFSNEADKRFTTDLRRSMIPSFSTTGKTETTVYQITLLETVQKAFEFTGGTGCGIPEIVLKGNTRDWQDIERRVEFLREYGLGYWADSLRPVLHAFAEASRGNVDRKFWDNMYKKREDYLQYDVNGWVTRFFPYLKVWDLHTDSTNWTRTERYEPNPMFGKNPPGYLNMVEYEFPSGISKVPVLWDNQLSAEEGNRYEVGQFPMLVYGGFFGVRQHADFSLEPAISWMVSYKSNQKTENR
ncbi:MAG: DUF4419 domain-containing protein [Bacteroidetes bacterium]|nr:DUF4419 domain-containing protein [Bacteroidota bacterium]